MERFIYPDKDRRPQRHIVNVRSDLDRAGVSNQVRALIVSLGIVFPRLELPMSIIVGDSPVSVKIDIAPKQGSSDLPQFKGRAPKASEIEAVLERRGSRESLRNKTMNQVSESKETSELSFPFPLMLKSEVKGRVKSLKASENWLDVDKDIFKALSKAGIVIARVKNKRDTSIVVIVPDEYVDVKNKEIKVPEKTLDKRLAKKKRAKNVSESLNYLYLLCKRDFNRLKKKMRAKNDKFEGRAAHSRQRFEDNRASEPVSAIDDDELRLLEAIDFYKEEMDRHRNIDEEIPFYGEEMDVLIEMAEEDPAMLEAVTCVIREQVDKALSQRFAVREVLSSKLSENWFVSDNDFEESA